MKNASSTFDEQPTGYLAVLKTARFVGRCLLVGLIVAALLLSACTTIGHEKIEGWPALLVVEHHVPHADMRDRCTRWGTAPLACAEIDLAARRCDIWFSNDFPPSSNTSEHERLHCAGHDHEGETHLRDFLAQHLAEQLRAEVRP